MPAVRSVAEIKTQLWQELALKAELITDGVAITQEALDLIQPGVIAQEQVHSLFEMDFDTHDFELPSGYDLPNGLSVGFRWNKRSGNVITADGNRAILLRDGHEHGEVKFHPRPGWYSEKTSDGQDMSTVGVLYRQPRTVRRLQQRVLLQGEGRGLPVLQHQLDQGHLRREARNLLEDRRANRRSRRRRL